MPVSSDSWTVAPRSHCLRVGLLNEGQGILTIERGFQVVGHTWEEYVFELNLQLLLLRLLNLGDVNEEEDVHLLAHKVDVLPCAVDVALVHLDLNHLFTAYILSE
jgi:hypothetical protein